MTAVNPLVSIVIPTRNRLSYVVPSVRSALRLPDPEIEVVVHDNSDNDELRRKLQELRDSRISYHFVPNRMSMTENYNGAVERSRGRFVSLIGDDDGVTAFFPMVARWAAANDLDTVVPVNTAHYIWPDLQLANPKAGQPGELKFQVPKGAVREMKACDELQKCLRNAGQSFAGLPKAYYGIVSRRAFDEVKRISGSYFPGISPDMASSVSLALVSTLVYHVDIPCFLPGSSAHSNAGLSGMNKHVGRLEDQPHLSKGEIASWSATVPKFFSVPTIWSEACVHALQAMGRSDLIADFNFPRLYSELLTYFPAYRPHVRKRYSGTFRAGVQSAPSGVIRLVAELTRLALLRGYFLFRRILYPIRRKHQALRGLNDIFDACNALEAELARQGFIASATLKSV